jgi:heterodisulfide reductase subunit A-like polyferredoxin
MRSVGENCLSEKKISYTLMALASVLALSSCRAMATRAGQRSSNIVIIGGGAAGLAAALEASTSGTEVYLLEKMSKVGGNSAKASSG